MWRSFFLALGIFSVILGVECMFIDKATITPKTPADTAIARIAPDTKSGDGKREISPPPWAPWSLLSLGSVVILYSFTLPQKLKSGG